MNVLQDVHVQVKLVVTNLEENQKQINVLKHKDSLMNLNKQAQIDLDLVLNMEEMFAIKIQNKMAY